MREDAMMKTGRYLPTPERRNSIGTFVQAGGRAGGRAGRQAGRQAGISSTYLRLCLMLSWSTEDTIKQEIASFSRETHAGTLARWHETS
jgi:hypothetical protein